MTTSRVAVYGRWSGVWHGDEAARPLLVGRSIYRLAGGEHLCACQSGRSHRDVTTVFVLNFIINILCVATRIAIMGLRNVCLQSFGSLVCQLLAAGSTVTAIVLCALGMLENVKATGKKREKHDD